jgi:stearoyl-CoA desaturase (delta-9 desaturase)
MALPSATQRKPHITDQPMTIKNWHHHIAWINVMFVAGIHLVGFIMSFSTPLVWRTAVWTLIYYFLTGLGITAGMLCVTINRDFLKAEEYYRLP